MAGEVLMVSRWKAVELVALGDRAVQLCGFLVMSLCIIAVSELVDLGFVR